MPNERLNDALLAADKVAVRWWKSKGGVPPGYGNESEVGVRAGACLNAFRAEYRDDVRLEAELASWGERQSESALVLAQWLENEGRVIAHLEARLNGEYEPYESSAAKEALALSAGLGSVRRHADCWHGFDPPVGRRQVHHRGVLACGGGLLGCGVRRQGFLRG